MSTSSEGGGPPGPSHGNNGPGGAEDGYPTEPIPQQHYPPQPAQPGYPQQGQPGQGYGQAPQQPYGQGQQGQGQQPQYGMGYPPPGQGWDQQGYAPSYGEPPKKSRTGVIAVIIIAVVALVVLAGVVWAVMGRSTEAEPQPTVVTTGAATPSEEPTSSPADDATPDPVDEPTVTPATPKDPATKPVEPPVSDDPPPSSAETPPAMPKSVGDYAAAVDPSPETGMWGNEDLSSLYVASWSKTNSRDLLKGQMDDPQEIGTWLCGNMIDTKAATCAAEVHGGTVLLVGTGNTTETAAFGDQLLAAWK